MLSIWLSFLLGVAPMPDFTEPLVKPMYECSMVRKSLDLMVEATAYSVDEDGGITCFGKPVIAGYTLAVDPKVIPYGSRVYFHSTGELYIASDCGGDIQGLRVDKAMANKELCYQYGRRYERVTVFSPHVTLEIKENKLWEDHAE